MGRASITVRLALLLTAILSAGCLALGIYFHTESDLHFREVDEATLVNAISRAEYALVTSDDPMSEQLHARLDSMLIGHDRVSMLVATDEGIPLAADSEITFPEEISRAAMAQASVDKAVLFTWERGEHQYRGLATRLRANDPAGTLLQVTAAINIDHHKTFLSVVLRALWISIACAVAVSVPISILIARGVMRPLRVLANQVHAISSNRLKERIVTTDLPVELIGFANAFNAMLTRLDVSFSRLSEFSADIAHEIRTPVSNLLTQTQVMLLKARTVDEYRDVLASNAEELERLSRMVSDMLFLAKTDHAQDLIIREPVDLAREARELFEFYEALAAEKSIELRLDGELSVEVERTMLRRALSNLLSNAIRHTAAGGRVQISLELANGKAWIHVSNPGAPLSEAVREKLFERFYRTDAARSRDTEGAGLGLAIVRAIAQAHGGGVSVASRRGTNIFSIFLPAASTAK